MKVRVRLSDRKQLVPEVDKLGPKGLERRVPLSVPVGMGDYVDGSLRQGTNKITP